MEELAHWDAAIRHAAEDALANLADDAEAMPARQIAEEIVGLLYKMQEAETVPDANGRDRWAPSAASLEVQGHILEASGNLTVLSRNMCLNFEANGAVRALLPYLGSGFGPARQKALALLTNLCTHTRMCNHTLTALGGVAVLWRLLPILVLLELACCSSKLAIIRQERFHVTSILRSVHGLPPAAPPGRPGAVADEKGSSWKGALEGALEGSGAEERANNVARAFLHKSRNLAGAHRRIERERTTRQRITDRMTHQRTTQSRATGSRETEWRLSEWDSRASASGPPPPGEPSLQTDTSPGGASRRVGFAAATPSAASPALVDV